MARKAKTDNVENTIFEDNIIEKDFVNFLMIDLLIMHLL